MDTELNPMQRAVMAKQLRQDPPPFDLRTGKAEEQVTMEVESRTDGLVVSGGHVLPLGKSVIRVYPSEVDSILGQVEDATKAEIKAVHAHLERHEAEVKTEAGSSHHWVPSFASSFKVIVGREIRPLVSAKVLSEGGEEAVA